MINEEVRGVVLPASGTGTTAYQAWKMGEGKGGDGWVEGAFREDPIPEETCRTPAGQIYAVCFDMMHALLRTSHGQNGTKITTSPRENNAGVGRLQGPHSVTLGLSEQFLFKHPKSHKAAKTTVYSGEIHTPTPAELFFTSPKLDLTSLCLLSLVARCGRGTWGGGISG